MNLFDIWISHLKSHPNASIECEICLRGDYKEPHECIFVNLDTTSKKCEDLFESDLGSRNYNLQNLMESQWRVSLHEDWKDDSHFFYFISLLLDTNALNVAKSIRFSTTNRYSTEVPGHEVLNKYQIPIPTRGLFRGIRINKETYESYSNLNIGAELPLNNHVMSMTELFGRGIDYSYRKRPLDPEFVNYGVLLTLRDFKGIPIAALSTYPVEREWRVLGRFYVEEVVKDISPTTYGELAKDWVLTDWNQPVEHVSRWSVITLRGESYKNLS